MQVDPDKTYRNKPEYYEAAKQMRDSLGPDIKVPVGLFLVAADELYRGDDVYPIIQLFEEICNDEQIQEITEYLSEKYGEEEEWLVSV